MLSKIMRSLLSLRYNITVTGLESVSSHKGALVIPNHPAEIDPVIISTLLWDSLRPRPVVLETFYNMPTIRPVMKTVRAIPMPDMEFDSGPYKRRRVERALDDVVTALKNGDSVLIYPSGRLSVSGEEKLGAASGVQAILQRYPDVPVVVVKIRGLYGSLFSKAATGGTTPDLFASCKRALGVLIQNGIFFSPKREVSVEFILNPKELPRRSDPLTLNRYLEASYNSPAKEVAIRVPYSRWSRALPVLPEQRDTDASNLDVAPELERKVIYHLAKLAEQDPASIKPEQQLGEHLGIDSLTVAELLLWLDREFEVSDVELAELTTVASVLRAASGQLGSGKPKHNFVVSNQWFADLSSRPAPELASVSTVPEAFLATASRFSGTPAMGDERSGIVSWSRLKVGSILLARYISTLPGDYIGLLFPASVGGSTASMAAMLARKVPVFLNWTAGKRSLEHAVKTTNLQKILTSRAFLDIVPVDLEFIEDRFVFLEDIIKNATLWDKLAAKRLASESVAQLTEAFGLSSIKADYPAVVLFTSGSESLPKGVPLSHKNILSNVDGIVRAFKLKHDDVLFGFLPPFHSFGLTVCSILPLVTGMRVAFYPNPNESRKIARGIEKWGVTLAAGTPTFLRSILQAGEPSQFKTLRFLVSGAEKAPAELYETVRGLGHGASLLEGYGITECSPVVTIGRPGEGSLGVGEPVASVKLQIVHPETLEPVSDEEQGLILIQGESVFSGYIGVDANPFIELRRGRETSSWYNSGDLGFLKNGSLVITGRLKRFIKIGGEMVSLGAIEEAILPHAPSTDGAPSVAVVSSGTEGAERPVITLITTALLSPQQANEVLQTAGFPHLVRVSQVKRVAALPVLGSGKTDYRALQAM